ncbi:hypothetical protein ACGFLS_32405 [Streptomyces abikoensis]|uniref:hypothetical protein n=1 Tax=Streptomyces abikoensis TaxID=97398 RepID=UPI0037109375
MTSGRRALGSGPRLSPASDRPRIPGRTVVDRAAEEPPAAVPELLRPRESTGRRVLGGGPGSS